MSILKPFEVDLVIKNANIITMNRTQPRANAVAVKFGRIIAVGTDEELAPYVIHSRNVLDLEGKCLLPGFIDCHTHLASTGVDFTSVQLGETKSVEEALQKISERIKELQPGEWVKGTNWDETKWKEKHYITGAELDRIAPRNPAYILRECGHLASVNSLALNELAIDIDQFGVEKDPEGNPTGVLKDVEVDYSRLLPPGMELEKAIKAACTYANQLGITTVHDFVLNTEYIAPYMTLRKRNELTVRVLICPSSDQLDLFQELSLSTGFGDEFLKLGAVKIFFDGSLGAHTAALSTAYADDPTTDGILMESPETLSKLVHQAVAMGFQTANHVIGDRAIDLVLEIFETLSSEQPLEPARHRLEHAEYLTKEHLQKVKALGLVLSQQPNFLKWEHPGGLIEIRLGPARYQELHHFRKTLDKGVPLCFGSDGMPLGPLYGIWEVVNYPNQDIRISVEEALYCYTLGAAKASFEEATKGSIEESKFADFVVLAEDPLTAPPQTICDLTVLMTIVGGHVVFKRDPKIS